jgi:hypothetical protein
VSGAHDGGSAPTSRPHIDYLEEIFRDSYKLHIDHSENVWRTLPFFSATVAFEMTAVVNLTPKLLSAAGLLDLVSVILLMAFIASIGVMVFFLFLSIKRRDFSYIAPSEELRRYAAWYVEQYKTEGSFTYFQLRDVLQDHLLEQWAAAGDAIRAINDQRAQHRERAGRGLLASIIVILALIFVSMIQSSLSHSLGESRHAPGLASEGAKSPVKPGGGSDGHVPSVQPKGVSQDEGTHDWVDLP